MVPNCIHGIDKRCCARCRSTAATKPKYPDALVMVNNKPTLILKVLSDEGYARALLLENKNYRCLYPGTIDANMSVFYFSARK